MNQQRCIDKKLLNICLELNLILNTSVVPTTDA